MTNGCSIIRFIYPASSDYTTLTRALVLNGATGSQTVTIQIRDDMVVENQFEFFSINLSTSDSAIMLDPVSAAVTVEDNDSELSPQYTRVYIYTKMSISSIPTSVVTIGFSGNYSVRENAGSVSITVLVLMNSLARDVTVTLSTVDDTAQGVFVVMVPN